MGRCMLRDCKQMLALGLLVATFGCASLPELESARRLSDRGDLVAAIDMLSSVLSKDLFAQQKEAVRAEIAVLKRRVAADSMANAASVYKSDSSVRGANAALASLNERLRYDDADDTIKGAIASYQKILTELESECATNLAKADREARAKNWSEAYRLLQAVDGLDPENGKVKTLKTGLVSARDEYSADQVRKAVKAQEVENAKRLLAAFLAETPSPARDLTQGLAAEVEALSRKVTADKIAACMKGQKFFTAYQLAKGTTDPGIRSTMAQIAEKGAPHYVSVAKQEMSAGSNRLGFAYFAISKAYELNPSDSEIFALYRDITDIFDRRIVVNIAISGFDSPTKDPDAGRQFSDALIAYLVDSLPYGIRIIERSKIDKLLAERGRELQQLSEEVKAEMFIVGNVSTLEVEHQHSEREVTEIISTGTKQEQNPAYLKMMVQYGPKTDRWPYVPAEILETPIREIVKYKKGEEHVKGFMVVSPRIFDTTKGCITVAKEYQASREERDTFCDAVPAANINADMLNLPTDNDVKDSLRKQLVAKVAATVIQAYEKREKRFLERALWYSGRREMDKAVFELACGNMYCERDLENIVGSKKNPDFLKIRELGVFAYTE